MENIHLLTMWEFFVPFLPHVSLVWVHTKRIIVKMLNVIRDFPALLPEDHYFMSLSLCSPLSALYKKSDLLNALLLVYIRFYSGLFKFYSHLTILR